jgi:hypothetical protein
LNTQKLEKSVGGPTPRTPEKQSPEANNIIAKEGETRPVLDLKVQASEIEKKVSAFSLDPSKKVNKEQTATIMRYFKDIRGIVEELLLHNSYLTGRLEQTTGEEKSKETAILSAVNKSLQASKRLETTAKKKTQTEDRQSSYTEKIKMTSDKVGQKAARPPRNVMIIHQEVEDNKITTSEQACDAVFTLVNPREKGTQVTAMRKISGNGLVVETAKP